MCLAEFSVYSNLKPCASTDRIVDLPQVTSCGPGPVSLPGAFISCGYFPGGLVGMIIDIEAGDPGRLSRPQIALPAADPHKAEIVELDIAVMAFADVPEQHRFAEAVVRRLRKGAGAGNRAAAVVEPVADDMPARNVVHSGSPIGCDATDYGQCALAGRAPRGRRALPARHD